MLKVILPSCTFGFLQTTVIKGQNNHPQVMTEHTQESHILSHEKQAGG